MRKVVSKISHQAVGAFGERSVEAELLRNGWIPANFNATVKNAAEFDIAARKATRQILLHVKACSSRMDAFQWGGFKPEVDIETNLTNLDFTILVQMGDSRAQDNFYIIPTRLIREQIRDYRVHYLQTMKRDGGKRKDTGHWTLRLAEAKENQERPQYGFARKWALYRNNWSLLDVPRPT